MSDGPGDLTPKATEDFLFHLYRGGELLLDGRTSDAKDELEQALRLKPRDPKAQDLLGVAYFRLGLYPRAVEVYEELLAIHPGDKVLSQNLSLCFVKNGQAERAKILLEDIAQLQTDPQKNWSVLGLTPPRRSDSENVRAAHAGIPRADRPGMSGVRAMPEPLDSNPPPSAPAPTPDSPASAPPASAPEPTPSDSSVPSAGAPPATPRVPTLTELVRTTALAFPVDDVLAVHPSGLLLVRAATRFALRRSTLHLLARDATELRVSALFRRVRGRATDEPLGGAEDPLVQVDGAAGFALASPDKARLSAFRMDDELVFLREALVVGFEASLSYENGRLAAFEADGSSLVQLRGSGHVVLITAGALGSVAVENDRATILARDSVVGWAGRLLPRAPAADEVPALGPGMVALTGEGTVFLSTGDFAREP